MANVWKKTFQLRQQVVYLGAFTAGCLMAGNVCADEAEVSNRRGVVSGVSAGSVPSGVESVPVPKELLTHDGRMNLLSPVQQQSSSAAALNPGSVFPETGGRTVSEFLSGLKQASQKSTATMEPRAIAPNHSELPPENLTLPQPPRSAVSETQSTGFAISQGPNLKAPQTDQKKFASQLLIPIPDDGTPDTSGQSRIVVPEAHVAELPKPLTPPVYPGVHRLSNISVKEFESSIVEKWQNRIKTASSADGRFVRVELTTEDAQRVLMLLDRASETLNFEGGDLQREAWHQIVENIDSIPKLPSHASLENTRLVDQNIGDPEKGELAIGDSEPAVVQQVTFLAASPQDITRPGEIMETLPPGTVLPQDIEITPGTQGIKNKVKILRDPDTGQITLVGDPEDLKIIKGIIGRIAEDASGKQPSVERIPLVNMQSDAVAAQIQSVYDASYASSKGSAQILPLASPNSLIVVGQPDSIEAVKKIVGSMDVVPPADEAGGFRAFQLQHISAADAKARLDTYFNQANIGQGDNQLPSAPVTVVADFRSNTVVVKGAIQFIRQAEQFLATVDVARSTKTNQVKVFPLRNTLAEDMAVVLQDAINGQLPNAGQGFNPNQAVQQQNNQGLNIQPTNSSVGSAQLSLMAIDATGQRVDGGIMFDVRVTADRNSNSLVVTGPEESMALIDALIQQLDRIPNAETQIKVFEIVNGDATTLLAMLQNLFGADVAQAGQQGANLSQLPLQGSSQSDGATLVNLRFSVDARTNTIIASGPAGDLQVVEDLLNRLDAQDGTDRRPRVYRLSNAPAIDVADAINAYLDPRSDIIADDPRTVGGFIQANRAVIVVPEVVSNSLIVSANPVDPLEIEELIRGLDRRPPVVKVKVLIAEVDLDSLEEFGVELGIQDSLLFDRGTSVAADGSLTGIGFPFNSAATANANGTFQETLAGQALSNLGTGRINNSVGFGGLVLSAGSESVSILMRALRNRQCVRVLSRPHIMTVENLQGRVQIGASVPRVSGTTVTNFGTTQDVIFEDVGVILEVTPRVSPDGMIVMAVNAVKSSVGPQETGVTIGFGANGEPILAPQINETEANTTLMARSGQTVVFSGLIQEEKTHIERGAPFLSDLPVIGPLFRFESDSASRSELLIVMTPYLVTDDQGIDTQNQDEMDRMHWCLCDVAEVYGNTDYRGYEGTEGGIETIYPDADPSGNMIRHISGTPQTPVESHPPQSTANSAHHFSGVPQSRVESHYPQSRISPR